MEKDKQSIDPSVPQFGVYTHEYYNMSTVISKQGTKITYQLPETQDCRYNIVLHFLLRLGMDQKANVHVKLKTDDAIDDLECIGIRSPSDFWMEQHIHKILDDTALSPNVG